MQQASACYDAATSLSLEFSYSLIRGCFTIGDRNEAVVDLSAHHLLVGVVG